MSKPKSVEHIWNSISVTGLAVDDNEWAVLCSFRKFNRGDLGMARMFINGALNKYQRLVTIEGLTARTIRKKINVFCAGLEKLYPEFSDLRTLNNLKQNLLPHSLLGQGKGASQLDDSQFERFRESADKLIVALKNCAYELPPSPRGTTVQASVHLIKELDSIVTSCSEGPLKRSDKNQSERGNDVQFVRAMFKIAESKTGHRVSDLSIDSAMKKVIRERNKMKISKTAL